MKEFPKRFDVIGVENPWADFAVQIDTLPKTDGECELLDFLWQSGGNAPNAIVAASRLGARTAMLGVVGNDSLGTFCKEDLAAYGVDVSHVYAMPGETNYCICLAEKTTDGRSFANRLGSNPPLTDEQIDEDFIASTRYLHVSMDPCAAKRKAIEYAKKNGVLVSLDGGYFTDEADFLISSADILIISESFYNALFTDDNYLGNCFNLLDRGPQIAVVTLGSKGCVGVNRKGESAVVPAFSGHHIVDTTGAGDVYHGAFLYAHGQGWDLERCLKFSSAVSYINCTSLGGRVGIPNLNIVLRFLEDGTIDNTEAQQRMAYYRNAMKFAPHTFS